jgi:hypothetical protein
MDNVFTQMSTKPRHNKLAGLIYYKLSELMWAGKAEVYFESCSLVHYGHQKEPLSMQLIDAANISDITAFKNELMYELDSVQPDIMFFMNNKFVHDSRGVRIAGCPDLIVEIWSTGNTIAHCELKRNLYSTSKITEHWYLEQDKNEVICYLGEKQSVSQDLRKALKTKDGIEVDLRYLSV